MDSNKIFPLPMIFVLIASVVLTVYPSGVSAQSNLPVPQFTVQYVDHSYDVPPVYGTNPYTGETIVKSGGYHVDNRTIDVTITNPPFTPYKDPSGNYTIYLYYNIREKGHFDDWIDATSAHSINAIQASGSAYTVISFDIQYWNVPQGGQIDFQVEAIQSYTKNNYNGGCLTGIDTVIVAQSSWSDAKTITIGTPIPASVTTTPSPSDEPNPTFNPYFPTDQPNPTVTYTPTQKPTATPYQPNTGKAVLFGFDWEQTALLVLVVVIAIFVVALKVVVSMRKPPAQ